MSIATPAAGIRLPRITLPATEIPAVRRHTHSRDEVGAISVYRLLHTRTNLRGGRHHRDRWTPGQQTVAELIREHARGAGVERLVETAAQLDGPAEVTSVDGYWGCFVCGREIPESQVYCSAACRSRDSAVAS